MQSMHYSALFFDRLFRLKLTMVFDQRQTCLITKAVDVTENSRVFSAAQLFCVNNFFTPDKSGRRARGFARKDKIESNPAKLCVPGVSAVKKVVM